MEHFVSTDAEWASVEQHPSFPFEDEIDPYLTFTGRVVVAVDHVKGGLTLLGRAPRGSGVEIFEKRGLVPLCAKRSDLGRDRPHARSAETADHAEAACAFVEKRPPVFQGG